MSRQPPSGTKEDEIVAPSDFVLGSPIPDPRSLGDKEFAAAIQQVFYNLLWLHSQHLYADVADQVMAKLFEVNLRNLSESDRNNLEAWFTDKRFLTLLTLLSARTQSPTGALQGYLDEILKKYKASAQEKSNLFEDVMLAHNQIWGSFIGLDNSILNLLIKIRSEKKEKAPILAELKRIRTCVDHEENHTMLLDYAKSSKEQEFEFKEEFDFSQRVLSTFLDNRINDIYMKTVDLCFYITDQREEYIKQQEGGFHYHQFLYDVLFDENWRGFLRNIQVGSIDLWLEEFFHTLLATLHQLTQRQRRDSDELLMKLHGSFLEDEGELLKALTSLSGNELDILGHLRLALLELIIKSGKQIDMRSDAECAKVLASIFLPPLKAIEELRVNGEHKSESIEHKQAELSIRKIFFKQPLFKYRSSGSHNQQTSQALMSQLLDRKGIRKEPPSPPSSNRTSSESERAPKLVPKLNPKANKKVKKNSDFSVLDIVLIVLGVILLLAAVALAIYLTIQTFGAAPVIVAGLGIGGKFAIAGAGGAVGLTLLFSGLRNKIGSFFNDLFSRSNSPKAKKGNQKNHNGKGPKPGAGPRPNKKAGVTDSKDGRKTIRVVAFGEPAKVTVPSFGNQQKGGKEGGEPAKVKPPSKSTEQDEDHVLVPAFGMLTEQDQRQVSVPAFRSPTAPTQIKSGLSQKERDKVTLGAMVQHRKGVVFSEVDQRNGFSRTDDYVTQEILTF